MQLINLLFRSLLNEMFCRLESISKPLYTCDGGFHCPVREDEDETLQEKKKTKNKKKLESVHRAQTPSQYIFQVQKLK